MTRIEVVRNAISSEKSAPYCIVVTIAALAAGTVIRLALASAVHLTFATYYPAVLICALLAGWRYGVACAVLSGLLAQTLFPPPGMAAELDLASIANLVLFLASCAIIIATADSLRRSVRELENANRRADTLNKELQHRVVNMIAVVRSLALQSAKGTNPESFVTAFSGRLEALGKAYELLGRQDLEQCSLPEIIDNACLPFRHNENLVKSGPDCQIPSASCVPLVLALHELCTNALKYGALASSEGMVDVSWSLAGRSGRLAIKWVESGGPAVAPPKRKGLGSALLRAQPGLSDVKLAFDKDGVKCTILIDDVEATEAGASDAASDKGDTVDHRSRTQLATE